MSLKRNACAFATSAIIALCYLAPVNANINAYEFQDPATEQRFRNLIAELRCPKCQNQNLADSNAPLAQDLRQKVYDMIIEERQNNEIKDYLIQRYGDFVTYRPPLRPDTWLLWFGPFIIILSIALLLYRWIRKRNKANQPSALDANEQERLKQLLTTYGKEAGS